MADGNYGSYNKANKSWNGMIGELLNQVLVLNILKFRLFIYGALFKHETADLGRLIFNNLYFS